MDVQEMPNIVPTEEREWFVLFAICVAGKNAKQTQQKVRELIKGYVPPRGYVYIPDMHFGPFKLIGRMIHHNDLTRELKRVKIGQYKRIEKAFREVIKLDITKDLTVEKLEAIPGIGPKTARFIVLYTDPNADCVPLDTHILKYLAKEFPEVKVPKSTPQKGKKYNWLEWAFQFKAYEEGKTVRQLDTEVWQSYAKG